MNTFEIIIDALTSKGYSESEAGELIRKFVEEQIELDDIRDMFSNLLSDWGVK